MTVDHDMDIHPRYLNELHETIRELLPSDRDITVLEAGCGSLSHVHFGSKARIVGIDISQEQLDRNEGLDERILGDLESYPLLEAAYDAIVCWYVFEHLRQPDQTLISFAAALAPGGVAVIAMPNVLSPKGLITKFTPHWFHVWAYRHIFGHPDAGLPGHSPFPTFIPLSMAPTRLRTIAETHGLQIAGEWALEATCQRELRERMRLRGPLWRFVRQAAHWLTAGHLDAEWTEYVLVLHKPASRQAPSVSGAAAEISGVA